MSHNSWDLMPSQPDVSLTSSQTYGVSDKQASPEKPRPEKMGLGSNSSWHFSGLI